jgi:peptidoglycan/LPS O-acetylase OafA/YrhL
VVLAHFNPWPLEVADGSGIGIVMAAARHLALGNLAVVFFFSLSAFLLTYRACHEFSLTGHFSVRQFVVRRVLRIWPLYFTVVAVAFLIQSGHARARIEFGATAETWQWIGDRVPLYAFFAGNWSLALNHIAGHVDHSPGPLRILWSIAVEEQFYIVYPFIALLVLRRPASRWPAVGLALLGAWGFRLWFSTLEVNNPALGSSGGMYYATLSYGDVLLAGGVAGWLAAKRDAIGPGHPLRRSWSGPVLGGLALAGGALWSSHLWYPYDLVSIAGYGVAGVLFGLLLLWSCVRPEHPVVKILACPPLKVLGTLSYGIYMWHVVSNQCLAAALNAWGKGSFVFNSPWLRLACSIGAAIMFASLTWWLVERPFLRLKGRFTSRTLSSP